MDYSKSVQSFRNVCGMRNGTDSLTSDVGTCSLLAIKRANVFTCNNVTHFSVFNFRTRNG